MPIEGPKERLQRVVEGMLNQAPVLFQAVLKSSFQVWFNEANDEQVLDMCSKVREMIDYIEKTPS